MSSSSSFSPFTVYVPVWQTWNLVQHRPVVAPSDDSTQVSTGSSVGKTHTQDIRERMQIARIQRRLTVHELATLVRCDVETLASFERGEGVVSDTVQERICSELRLH